MAKRTVHHVHTTLHLVGLSSPASSHVEWAPNTDIFENESSFIVRMEIAGVTREDIQIRLLDNVLVVSGCRSDTGRASRCRFRQMEINYGVFERRLLLPQAIDGKHVKASYQNGFLTIELAKASKGNGGRQVVVDD